MTPPLDEPQPTNGTDESRVPLFGTWRNAYFVVIVVLVVNILVLYACTRLLS